MHPEPLTAPGALRAVAAAAGEPGSAHDGSG